MGAAGMMSAAAFKDRPYVKKISLIGSPHIPTIGVGESTTLAFEEFHARFEDSLKEFVTQCDAAVKYGVYYKGWNKGKSWLHYFKTEHQTDSNNIDHFDYGVLLGNKPENVFIHDIYGKKLFEYANQYQIPCKREDASKHYPFSWHFDAGKYIQYMISLCKKSNKVEFISDTVVNCDYKFKNNIESINKIKLSSGVEIEADYYIISTGSSDLNEKIFGIKYNYITNLLLTNKAIFLPLKYKNKREQFHPYTVAKTMKNGWRWITPTWSRIGTGYVFSSNHISEDEAVKELLEDIGDFNLTPNVIDFIPRYNPDCFKTNSCTVGMASGFLEPLDAPGLTMTTNSIQNLLQEFDKVSIRNHILNDPHNTNHIWNSIIRDLSVETQSIYDYWCSFILTQYKTCHRDDTNFWKDHKKVEFDFQRLLVENINNRAFWPDYGAAMMFQQTISSRNIQWKTESNQLPFKLDGPNINTMHHYDYIKNIHEGVLEI